MSEKTDSTLAGIVARLESLERVARNRGSLACDHLAEQAAGIRRDLEKFAAAAPGICSGHSAGGSGHMPTPAEALRCTCPSGDGSLRWPCPAHPAEAQAQGGGDSEQMTGDLLPCPFCGKSNQDRYPCEWLDGSGANVIRCAWCHGAAPMNVWNRRTAPPSAPVGNVLSALAEAVYSIPVPGGDFHKGWRDEEIWEWALRKARDLILAQQPAAVDGADTKRLDFLEASGWPGQFYPDPSMPADQRWFDSETPGSDYSATLRAAIDGAIAAQQGGES